RVGQISLLARLEHDPGEDHRLVRTGLGQFRERHQVLHVQVVANALPVVERAVLLPDRRGLFGNAPVVLDPILPNRDDEPIDVPPHSLTLPNTNVPPAAEQERSIRRAPPSCTGWISLDWLAGHDG